MTVNKMEVRENLEPYAVHIVMLNIIYNDSGKFVALSAWFVTTTSFVRKHYQ